MLNTYKVAEIIGYSGFNAGVTYDIQNTTAEAWYVSPLGTLQSAVVSNGAVGVSQLLL